MTGHRPFSELTRTFTPERRARCGNGCPPARSDDARRVEKSARILTGRRGRDLTVGQPAVAKLEKRTDMHVSNLRRYVEALGGTLEITARFRDASVVVTNIGEGP